MKIFLIVYYTAKLLIPLSGAVLLSWAIDKFITKKEKEGEHGSKEI